MRLFLPKAFSPFVERAQNWRKAAAQFSERVFYFGRNYGKYFSLDQSGFFHFPQRISEDFVGDAAYFFLKLAGSLGAFDQMKKDKRLPFASNVFHGNS